MRDRFRASPGQTRRGLAPLFSAVLLAALLCACLLFFSQVSEDAAQEQKKSLEAALLRGVTQCYALEGRYPESLSYLREHYGISYDETRFYVDYRPVAENLLPDVTVLVLGGAS